MIRTKVDKTGHSTVAAIRKHAKFLRDEMGEDYLTALEQTTEAYREARELAFVKEGDMVTCQFGSTMVTVAYDNDSTDWWVTFSVVTSSYEGGYLQ